jgi:hypothetical protein
MVEVFEDGGARPMSETWMELLERMGVFGEKEICRHCKKRVGTVQMWSMKGGEKYPLYKICTECHQIWREYKPKKARRGR